MGSAILPASQLNTQALAEYLERHGVPADWFDWKYCNAEFNRGRERGFAWVRDGKVCGFLGLIPLTLEEPPAAREAAWICDWSLADPLRSPGIGVRLLERARSAYGLLLGVGGTGDARAVLERFASHTLVGALRIERRLLRTGARRNGARELGHRLSEFLTPTRGVVFERGVSPRLAALLDPKREDGGDPLCDLASTQWQLGGCPAVEVWTAAWPAVGPPAAACLAWREPGGCSFRLALWGDGSRAIDRTLVGAVRALRAHGAHKLAAGVARGDHVSREVLAARGFRLSEERPLYVCAAPGVPLPSEPRRLSFLATDLAHRFEKDGGARP